MKIILFGASGTIGQRIAHEAIARGHNVTAVVRDPSRAQMEEGVTAVQGDVTDPDSVAQVAAGHDAAVSASGPGVGGRAEMLVEAVRGLLAGLPRAGVRRLIVVNGAGSLEVAPGLQLLDTPQFPADWRPLAVAHRDALDVLRGSTGDLDWTALSPAAFIEPGARTGQYRTGTEQLVADATGQSHISAEDYACALLDELENPQFVRQRFTVAY
jgi:putative NADH-flavin reductase